MRATSLRRGAGVVAAAVAALLGGLPFLVERQVALLEGGLALAATATTLEALLFVPSLLPPAVALYAAELVVLVQRRELALWAVPLLAVGLLLIYETGDLRYRPPPDAIVEAGPRRALMGRVALTAVLGLLASASVAAASSLSSRGGAAAAVVGGLAIVTVIFLVKMLARAGGCGGRGV